jgi:hypothetical protein
LLSSFILLLFFVHSLPLLLQTSSLLLKSKFKFDGLEIQKNNDLFFRGGSASDRKPLLSLVDFALLVLRQQGLATFQRNKVRGAVKFPQSWGQRVANHNQHLSSEQANPHQNPLPVRMPVMSSEEP